MTAKIGHNSGGGSAAEPHDGTTVLNSTAQSQLRSVLERVENLVVERDEVNEQIKEVLAEAKGNGFDVKIIRALLKIRKQDRAKRQEELAMLALYASACGMGDLV